MVRFGQLTPLCQPGQHDRRSCMRNSAVSAPEKPSAIPSSYDPDLFRTLFTVEDRHFWFRARNRLIRTLTRQVTARLPAGYRVLEVGCGTGNVLRYLEQASPRGTVIGMDLF